MRKNPGILFLVLGTVLMLSALFLFAWNQRTAARAGNASSQILAEMQTTQETTTSPEITPETIPETTQSVLPMPTTVIGGNEYIGTLTIPALDLELPIMLDWDYDKLDIAPCRHFGNPASHDLVIAGHNYSTHFASLSKLQGGEEVIFTDVNGTAYHYRADKVEVIPPEATELVQTSGYPLTLYTCTPGGANRTAVFCKYPE